MPSPRNASAFSSFTTICSGVCFENFLMVIHSARPQTAGTTQNNPLTTNGPKNPDPSRARRQERSGNLESHNRKDNGLNAPTHNPGRGRLIKRRHHEGRYTRYVALHLLCGPTPVTWRYTRYVALHPLRGAAPEQNGCNAYGSGAMPTGRVYHAPRQEQARNLESHNTKDSGLNAPALNPGLDSPSGVNTHGQDNDSNSRAQLCRRGRKERGARVGQPF